MANAQDENSDPAVIAWRLRQLEDAVASINEHGTKPGLLGMAQIAELTKQMREVNKAVAEELPLLRQDMQRYAESWRAVRTALYALASIVLASAILVVVLGHK